MKTCTACNKDKLLDEFVKMSKAPDGLNYECAQCRTARRLERRERDYQMRAVWRARPENREKERAYMRNRHNTPEGQAYQKAWEAANPDKVAAKFARYKKRHKDKVNALNQRRRAMKLSVFVEDVNPNTLYQMHGGACGICKEFIIGDFHVDHIVPLSRGGLHSYANTQPAHAACNLSKGNKLQDEMVS